MKRRRSLLIFTNSYDLSANRIVRAIGGDRIFRFNFDLWHDYRIELGAGDFEIANPTGHSISRDRVAKAYWRKPISRFLLQDHHAPTSALRRWVGKLVELDTYPPKMTPLERYLEAEMDYLVGELRNLLWKRKKLVLVEPSSHVRLGRMVQLEFAAKHFDIPPYRVFYNPPHPAPSRPRVAKSLSSERLGANRFLWTTAIDEAKLDSKSPWYVQDLVEADKDVTVVCIRNRTYAFELERNAFVERSVDWREFGDVTTPLWRPHRLTPTVDRSIKAFMREVGLDFGRLDFLLAGGRYWFLEVNANGEWGWLDPDGKQGVLKHLVRELHPDTPVHPIPHHPF